MNESSDLVVFDQEFTSVKTVIKGYGDSLAQMMETYIDDVQFVLSYAIHDDLITEALMNLVDQVRPLINIVQSATQSIGESCSSFVRDIDEADKFLY